MATSNGHVASLTEDRDIVDVASSADGEGDGLTSQVLSSLDCFNLFIQPKSQYDFYVDNDASSEILRYVGLQGKSFGEKHMEQIAKEFFKLEKRKNSTHDHIKLHKTIEQKSARYHANGNDWKWQHIEMSHRWDFLLLCGLDFKGIRYYISSRKVVENLICEDIITGQGKKINGVAHPQQAYWFSRSDFGKKNKLFGDYFTEIKNEQELITYLHTI